MATESAQAAANGLLASGITPDWLGRGSRPTATSPAPLRTDVLIVGAGNGGMVAAATASDLGVDFLVAEQFDTVQDTRHWTRRRKLHLHRRGRRRGRRGPSAVRARPLRLVQVRHGPAEDVDGRVGRDGRVGSRASTSRPAAAACCRRRHAARTSTPPAPPAGSIPPVEHMFYDAEGKRSGRPRPQRAAPRATSRRPATATSSCGTTPSSSSCTPTAR